MPLRVKGCDVKKRKAHLPFRSGDLPSPPLQTEQEEALAEAENDKRLSGPWADLGTAVSTISGQLSNTSGKLWSRSARSERNTKLRDGLVAAFSSVWLIRVK